MTSSVVDPGLAPETALDTAVSIAAQLVEQAVWLGDRCNWVGAEPLERVGSGSSGSKGVTRLTYRALGPDLYGGTSGVALYLAELAAVTGDAHARRTALGAMRHALSRRGDVEPAVQRGLYVGWTGIGYAAIRTGIVLSTPEMVERGHALIRETVPAGDGQHIARGASRQQSGELEEFDLIAGGSGAVLGSIAAYRLTGDPCFRAGALAVAEQLLRDARRHEFGWSWPSPQLRTHHDLTGLSHGAAGVAVALLEAFDVTADAALADGARQAMRYENHWFDHAAGNWPDFRPDVNGRRRSHGTVAFASLWCHGAPGIALARAHAYRILGEPAWFADATVAVRTTASAIRAILDTGGANFSLCHGLAGSAECLLEAGRIVDESSLPAETSDRVARYGVEHYAATALPWPCGTHTDTTPGLMLGMAGIGYFYLRRAVPDVPSILLPVAIGIRPLANRSPLGDTA